MPMGSAICGTGMLEPRSELVVSTRNPEYLKKCEEAYLELSGLYNWNIIECVEDGKMKSIETINDTIIKIVKETRRILKNGKEKTIPHR